MRTRLNYTDYRMGEWISLEDFISNHMDDGSFLMIDGMMVVISSINTHTSSGKVRFEARKISGGSIANGDLELEYKAEAYYRLPETMGAIFHKREGVTA